MKDDDGIITADPHDEHGEKFGAGSFKGTTDNVNIVSRVIIY